jgi:phosphate transport system permease protein
MTLTADGSTDLEAPTSTIPAVDPTAVSPATPPRTGRAAADLPRRIGGRTVDEVCSLLGAAVGSLGLVWIIYEKLLPFTGIIGFFVSWWVAFIALYAGVTLLSNPAPIARDRLASSVVATGAVIVFGALLCTVVWIFYRGWPALHHWNFYTDDMAGVRPTDPLTKGGVRHAVVGSGIEIGIATVISLPLGVGTAVYLTEVGGRASQVVRTVVEAMTALPDILAGLFIYTVLIVGLHWERTGFAAALALSVTMIPVIARSAEVVLRVVPGGLREASLALGASRWQTVRRVVLPTARSGLATALILGVARIAGETAPLLIVSGASTFSNNDPFHNPMNSLPLFIFSAVRSGEPLYIARGMGAAALLLLLVLVLFVMTRFLARDKSTRR